MKALAIHWTRRAIADLESIRDFIAQDDEDAASRWIQKLLERIEAAATIPRAGRRVPEIGHDDVREVLVRQYRLVYRLEPGRLVVLTVFEGHRLLPPVTPPRR